MPFDPNIPRFDKRAIAICIVVLVLLIVGIWLAHTYVITNYSHPTQPFSPPAQK
jgi:hypothetical protein